MSDDRTEFNRKIIEEFRANGGEVGGNFAGSPMALVHHRGRRTGTERIAPVMYLRDQADPSVIYVFASKAGGPVDPDWYHNLLAAGTTTVEVGTETYEVSVTELTGEERDRIYAEQVRAFPRFGEYAEKAATHGRTIPVLRFDRV